MQSRSSSTTYVWDIVVRSFHWGVVAAFALAYLTAEEWMAAHKWLGYTITVLVLARLVWGVIGSRHARFASFLASPRNTLNYLKQLATGKAPRYLGHNPAGAWMIVALLLALLATTGSGMLMIAPAGKGPLAHTVIAGLGGHWLEDVHEVFANLTVALALVHVGGVLFSSLLHRENLVRSMLTGYKRSSDSPATASSSASASVPATPPWRSNHEAPRPCFKDASPENA